MSGMVVAEQDSEELQETGSVSKSQGQSQAEDGDWRPEGVPGWSQEAKVRIKPESETRDQR